MAYIDIHSGSQTAAHREFDKDRMVVGRHPDCDIIVETAAVSRHHAALNRVNDEYFVEDLRSRNGTFVNEERVTDRRRLSDLDQIRVCDVLFVFHATAQSANDSVQELRRTGVYFDDADQTSESSIVSKLDVSSSTGLVRLSASADVKLQAILELQKNLGRSLSLDEVLPHVLDSLFKIFFQADRGFIVLRGPDGELQPRWSKFRREETAARISRTIINHVVEAKEAVLSADASGDQRFDMAESIMDFSIRSMMCAPLIDGEGEVLGALQIDTVDQRNRFRDKDLEVLAGIASQAGIAIVNAQLHEEALVRKAIQRDLELAHRVQMNLLPRQRPEIAGYEFCDYYRAANQIGGDYFDYVALPDGRLATMLADVSGHGIAAALLMARLSAEARYCLATVDQPALVLDRLNALLCSDQADDSFVTMAVIVLKPDSGTVTVANAGHAPPALRRPNGQIDFVGCDVSGMPLGVAVGQSYDQADQQLEAGELLTVYTDGIPEALDTNGNTYGSDRLLKLISTAAGNLEEFGNELIDDVRHFTGTALQSDDMCMVCMRRSA